MEDFLGTNEKELKKELDKLHNDFEKKYLSLLDNLSKEQGFHSGGILNRILFVFNELSFIRKRLEKDAEEFKAASKLCLKHAKQAKGPEELKNIKLAKRLIEALIILGLDLKSFFIFSRVLIDSFTEVIRIKKGENIPSSMNKLLKKENKGKYEEYFIESEYSQLLKQGEFFFELKNTRDKIIHKMEIIIFNYSIGEDLKFNLKNIEGYNLEEIIEKTSEKILNLFEFIISKLSKT